MKRSAVVISLSLLMIALVSDDVSLAQNGKRVLIVYHGGTAPWQSAPAPHEKNVDTLTQATTEKVNVESITAMIAERLTKEGCRVNLKKAMEVDGPEDFLDADGIIFGTPTWFSNVAWPVKMVFDEHLIRIYEHRKGRLNDKAMSGFTTVMERGESGPNSLRSLFHGIEHLSSNTVEGAVINTSDDDETVNRLVNEFIGRFVKAMK